ncbi:adenosylcobinamide-GDP ribazoletransferase [uncultured Roseobacter sp.]|uniref:adenosylcobinamide-GDP ribazoletransferase n=1 Tax=uncultured Roseobacter sp. TaxID=114847 RepID=UPI00262E5C75|nr:adenosylcobinamide-GDP ribazoletransferase [uncultured Roseobacter sp.]
MKTDKIPFWLTDLLLAGSLLTRLPLPHVPPSAFERAAHACWAYPVVGAVIGGLAGIAASIFLAMGLPAVFAAGGLLAVLMLLTGAMHEDGLGDTADGFWGGFDRARRLEIMKDSQTGTYGILALLIVTGLRWSAYATLLPLGLWSAVAAAALSRAMMPCMMAALPHAREAGLSQSVGRPDAPTAVLGLGIALLLAGLSVGSAAIGGLLVALAIAGALGWLAHQKISGQTGDVLGATQQLAEVGILAVFVLLLP